MSVACHIRVVFVEFGQASIFFQCLCLRAKFQWSHWTDFLSFLSGILSEADNMAIIQLANSALALAIRLELLFFR